MRYVEWEEFFEAIDKLVHRTADPWSEKRKAVLDAAILHDATATLDEFLAWFGGSLQP